MENRLPSILVVQDDDQASSLARHALGEEGYDVLTGKSNAEGWSVLVEYRPPIAVVDRRPGNGDDGFEFVEHVRADGRFAEMPIVLLMAPADEQELARATSLGCDVLTKPYSSNALIEKVWSAARELQRAHRAVPDPSRRVATSSVPTVILLPDYRVTGYLHLPQEIERFSDALESLMRDGREFVLVTEAVISSVDGSRELSKVRYIGVAKSHIRGVFPVE